MKSRRSILTTTRIILAFIALVGGVSLTIQSPQVSAHRSGCHRWHSCPSDSGSYTCGDTGHSSYCATPTYTAPVPVITTKDEVVEQNIPILEVTTDNPNEYVGYKKMTTQGVEGLQSQTTSVTYSDGSESSRGAPSTSILHQSINTVFDIGTRVKPTGWVDYVSKSDTQSFWSFLLPEYDISASAPPNRNFALIKNGRVIRLGTSNKAGMLNFKAVGARTGDTFSIGTYTGSQFLWFMPSATKVSDTSTINTDKLTVTAEYDILHDKTSDRTNESIPVRECSQDKKDAYIASLDKMDKLFFDSQGSARLYYTEIPCDVHAL